MKKAQIELTLKRIKIEKKIEKLKSNINNENKKPINRIINNLNNELYNINYKLEKTRINLF